MRRKERPTTQYSVERHLHLNDSNTLFGAILKWGISPCGCLRSYCIIRAYNKHVYVSTRTVEMASTSRRRRLGKKELEYLLSRLRTTDTSIMRASVVKLLEGTERNHIDFF